MDTSTQCFGGNNTSGPIAAAAVNAKGGAGRMDFESETLVVAPCLTQNYGKQPDNSDTSAGPMLVVDITNTNCGGEVAGTLEAAQSKSNRGQGVLAPIPILEADGRQGLRDSSRDGLGIGEQGDPMFTLQSGKQHAIAVHGTQDPCVSDVGFALGRNNGQENAVVFDTTQITSKGNYSNPQPGDPCHPLAESAHVPAIAFTERGRDQGRTFESQEDLAYALCNPGSDGRTHSRQVFTPTMAVRRLTPRECERLQGFPDDHTLVPHRGKPAADGPRYKALGNAMAVPVLAWIGRRIMQLAETGGAGC